MRCSRSSPAQKTSSKQRCFWDSLGDLLKESELLPINQAAHRLASLLQEYRGAWPLIKSDAEVDPERGKALAAALAKRRVFLNSERTYDRKSSARSHAPSRVVCRDGEHHDVQARGVWPDPLRQTLGVRMSASHSSLLGSNRQALTEIRYDRRRAPARTLP